MAFISPRLGHCIDTLLFALFFVVFVVANALSASIYVRSFGVRVFVEVVMTMSMCFVYYLLCVLGYRLHVMLS